MREEPQEKTLAKRNNIEVGYDFDERPWLQLMCCALVSGHEIGYVFWSEGKSSEKRSLGSKIETEWTGIGLEPVDINLQTEELHCITNFIWPYLHQFFIDSHGLNGYRKPLKRPFNRY